MSAQRGGIVDEPLDERSARIFVPGDLGNAQPLGISTQSTAINVARLTDLHHGAHASLSTSRKPANDLPGDKFCCD